MRIRPLGAKATRNRARVLLVESYDDTRDMIAEYLRLSGFVVMPVASTDDAAAWYDEADAVVTGIGVKGTMDGLGLVRALRRAPATARTPIVVVTAHAFDRSRIQALNAGADVFLPKPCFPDDLVSAIRRTLALNRVPKPRAVAAYPRQRRHAAAS